jgi:ABC-type nitrate/sulfonate/bicarbonate transport system ATPase subunit
MRSLLLPRRGAEVPGGSVAGGVEIDGVHHTFAAARPPLVALEPISISAAPGEFVTVLGPSGCGKSTLFHIVAGLIGPSGGDVRIGGRSVLGSRGRVSYMPQGDHLLPWRTVLDNSILGLEVDRVDRRRARRRATELLRRFGLGEFAGSRPDELSGGMRQRVAFIRTLLFEREVLLLDEPLGALDAQTRLTMQEWLLEVWGESGRTVLFITHDVEEAVFLSDRVLVMSARPGRIVDAVEIDLERPRTPRVRLGERFLALRGRLLEEVRSESGGGAIAGEAM